MKTTDYDRLYDEFTLDEPICGIKKFKSKNKRFLYISIEFVFFYLDYSVRPNVDMLWGSGSRKKDYI